MTGSSRHARFMVIQKELNPEWQCLELEQSVHTRWGSKSGSVTKILTLLNMILETFAENSETSHGLTKQEADSFATDVNKEVLVSFSNILKRSSKEDFATQGLQSPAEGSVE